MKLSAQDFAELKELEERLWIVEFRFDRAWMEDVLAYDFSEFGRSGRIYSRNDCLDFDRGETIDAVIPLPDFKARYISSDVVQTTYISSVIYDGEVERGNRSSIWLKTATGWKLKFHQGTPAKKQNSLNLRLAKGF